MAGDRWRGPGLHSRIASTCRLPLHLTFSSSPPLPSLASYAAPSCPLRRSLACGTSPPEPSHPQGQGPGSPFPQTHAPGSPLPQGHDSGPPRLAPPSHRTTFLVLPTWISPMAQLTLHTKSPRFKNEIDAAMLISGSTSAQSIFIFVRFTWVYPL